MRSSYIFSFSDPITLNVPDKVEYNASDDCYISCEFDGYPLNVNSIAWRLLNSGEIISTVNMTNKSLILYLLNIKREQSGIYECYLEDDSTNITAQVNVVVKC